jgi:intein-encoded DNA endonuclease-like protein
LNGKWSYGVYPSKEVLENLYYNRSLSQREIARVLNCDRMRVRRAFWKHGLTTRTSKEGQRIKDYSDIYKKNDTPDLTPSPHLAYVLGVLKGDGSVSIHRNKCSPRAHAYKITLGNVENKEFAESFKRSLEYIGVKARIYEYNGHWYVDACSKRFTKWYTSLTLWEIEHMLTSEALAKEFLRGFYESEGGYGKIHKKVHGVSFWDWRVSISNTDSELLNLVSRLLLRFGFHHKIYGYQPKRRGKRIAYRLWIWGKTNAQRFMKVFSPVIKNTPRVWICKREW